LAEEVTDHLRHEVRAVVGLEHQRQAVFGEEPDECGDVGVGSS